MTVELKKELVQEMGWCVERISGTGSTFGDAHYFVQHKPKSLCKRRIWGMHSWSKVNVEQAGIYYCSDCSRGVTRRNTKGE